MDWQYLTGKTGAGIALMGLALLGLTAHLLDREQAQTLFLAGYGLTTAGAIHKAMKSTTPGAPGEKDGS